MPANPLYACLTSDLVGSRSQAGRAEVQVRIEAALAGANRDFAAAMAVPFAVTLGDEWQGLLKSPAAALKADFQVRRALYPLAVASGVGLGPVATPLRERTALMDGPCFHRARQALERAKERKGAATALSSGQPLLDEPADALCLLLHALERRWTRRQFESLCAYLEHGTEAAAARVLGVTQPTLHKSLDGAQAKVYLEAREALIRFLGAYPLEGLSEGQS